MTIMMPTRKELKPAEDHSQQHAQSSEEDEEDGISPDTSSNAVDASASVSINGNGIKRARSTSTEPCPPNPSSSLDDGSSHAPLTLQQTIEMQQETMHHVEMAWRAQQRLVRRCLGLYISSEATQSADANNFHSDSNTFSLSEANGTK